MPWKESSVMEERLRFVARLLEGEAMSDVCRQFGVSRKTGYKLLNRYREEGPLALCDRSRRPVRYANQLPEQVERLIVQANRHRGVLSEGSWSPYRILDYRRPDVEILIADSGHPNLGGTTACRSPT